jgi:hypothetical protein
MMKLFQKNEVTFAVLLIVIYVVGSSIAQRVSDMIGIEFLAETLFTAAMAAGLWVFIRKNGLSAYLGLKRPEVSAKRMLFYIPLVLTGGAAAFFGMGMEYSLTACVLHTVTMLFVGFLEEVIFRGFLFRGIAGKNLTRAVVISSLTFGIGHFVNLLNGSDLFENAVQVIYAVAVGFLLVFLFLRTSSLLPCIAFHAFNNIMTAFSTGDLLINRLGEQTGTLVLLGIQLAVAAGYLLYVTRLPKRELPARS